MLKFTAREAILDYCTIYITFLLEGFIYSWYIWYINASRDLSFVESFILSSLVYLWISFWILIIYYVIFKLLRATSFIPRNILFIVFLGIWSLSTILWEIAYNKMLDAVLKEDIFLSFYFRNNSLIITGLWISFFLLAGFKRRK